MKKFSKILLLLLAVVAILTAFTVVTLAEEVTEEPKYHFYKMRENWEGKADGTFIGNSVDRYGNMTAKWTDDGTEKGNYYILYQPKANANGNTATNLDDIDFASSKTYNIGDYPYIMLSYDIMTPTGSFNNPLIYLKGRYTKDDGSAAYVSGTFTYNFGIANGSVLPHLDKTPYHWQHISVIIEPVYTVYEAGQEGVDENNVGKISSFKYIITMYVNDKLAYTYTTGNYASMTGYLPTRLGHNQIRINTTGASKTNDATALDNLSVSYFKADFATSEETKYSEMVAAVYNEDYELPYGQTVAMIGDVKYQDIDDAIAAAKDGDVIKLTVDQVESPYVEKNVVFDRNDGNGELYNITVTHPSNFQQKEKDGILTVSKITYYSKAMSSSYWDDAATSGTIIGHNQDGYGKIFMEQSYNKENKYVVFEPRIGSKNAYIEPGLVTTIVNQGTADAPDKNFVYNHKDFPYVAFDFDIMTPTGKYDTGVSINFRSQHTAKNNGSHEYIGFYAQLVASSIVSNLDKTPFKWQHLTFIVEYDDHSQPGKILYRYYVYINGSDTPAYTGSKDITTALGSYDPSDLGFSALRINGTSESPAGRQTAFDNFSISYFTSEFGTTADMARVVYTDGYQFPFGKAVATINGFGYDDINKAIEAAEDGDTIVLLSNVEGTVVVDNKAIKIDRNIYDENGVSTGMYEIKVSSATHVPTEENGIIDFKYLPNAFAQIYWDRCPGVIAGGECTCPDIFRGHVMSAVSESVMLNTIPVYPGNIPEFAVIDGFVKKFVGWSYTQGGEVEELRPVTIEDCELGYIALYPVYTETQYDIEVKDLNGDCEYFMADKYYTALSTAKSGSTITLYNNIETAYGVTVDKVITIDLNGYSLRKWNISNVEYYYTDAEYTATTVLSYGSKSSIFYIGGDGAYLTIKSSKPGATVYNGTLMAKNLYWSDKNRTELIKETTHGGIMGGAIVGWGSAIGATLEIQGENLSMFGSVVVDADSASAKNSTVIINGGTYYRTVSDYSALLTNRNGANFEVKNATFYGNGASLLYVWAAKTKQHQDMNFDNCTFVEGDFYTNDSALITFTNCRLESTGFKNGNGDASYEVAKEDVKKFVLGKGCRVNGEIGKLGNAVLVEGLIIFADAYSMSVTRSALTAHKLLADKTDLDKNATYNAGNKQATYNFAYVVIDPETDLTNIKWVDSEGYLLGESVVLKNATVSPLVGATVPSGDGWRNVVITDWKNANGEVNYAIGDADEYVFTAVIPTENIEYAAGIADARLSLAYYAQFHLNFYLPVTEGMEAPVLSGTWNDGKTTTPTVLIDGVKYWCYVGYSSTAGIFNRQDVTVSYTIDGESYNQTFGVSGLIYAQIVLSSPASDAEAKAVANMVRYVRESLQAYGSTDNALFTAIDALIGSEDGSVKGLYTLEDYATEYGNVIPEKDYVDIGDYIYSIKFMVTDGGYAAYVFDKTAKGLNEGVTISVKTENGVGFGIRGDYAVDGETGEITYYKSPWTLNTRVYDLVDTIIITVNVPEQTDAETGEVIPAKVVTGKYSIDTYINATNDELSKALYAFGMAAKEYRNSVIY